MGTTIDEIIDSLRRGQGKRVRDLVNMALDEGESYQTILKDGFLRGMEQITDRFREEEVGVPEILSITRALDQGISALNSYTGRRPVKELGPVFKWLVPIIKFVAKILINNLKRNILFVIGVIRTFVAIIKGMIGPVKLAFSAVASAAKGVYEKVKGAFSKIKDAIAHPFETAKNIVR